MLLRGIFHSLVIKYTINSNILCIHEKKIVYTSNGRGQMIVWPPDFLVSGGGHGPLAPPPGYATVCYDINSNPCFANCILHAVVACKIVNRCRGRWIKSILLTYNVFQFVWQSVWIVSEIACNIYIYKLVLDIKITQYVLRTLLTGKTLIIELNHLYLYVLYPYMESFGCWNNASRTLLTGANTFFI